MWGNRAHPHNLLAAQCRVAIGAISWTTGVDAAGAETRLQPHFSWLPVRCALCGRENPVCVGPVGKEMCAVEVFALLVFAMQKLIFRTLALDSSLLGSISYKENLHLSGCMDTYNLEAAS